MSSSVNGDWICQLCGNRNYGIRTHCNMRKCRAARGELPGSGKRPYDQTFQDGGKRQRVDMRSVDPRLDIRSLTPPSIDLPNRGFPPPPYYPFPPPVQFPQLGTAPTLLPSPYDQMPSPHMQQHTSLKSSQQSLVPGMWKCIECGNMNYPSRTNCNMRKCSAKKPEDKKSVDLWKCGQCGNINYPSRTICNMKKCQAPRNKEAEMWTCTECGNMNYNTRVICNMRKCGAPRKLPQTNEHQETEVVNTSLSTTTTTTTTTSTGGGVEDSLEG